MGVIYNIRGCLLYKKIWLRWPHGVKSPHDLYCFLLCSTAFLLMHRLDSHLLNPMPRGLPMQGKRVPSCWGIEEPTCHRAAKTSRLCWRSLQGSKEPTQAKRKKRKERKESVFLDHMNLKFCLASFTFKKYLILSIDLLSQLNGKTLLSKFNFDKPLYLEVETFIKGILCTQTYKQAKLEISWLWHLGVNQVLQCKLIVYEAVGVS